jgi:hypothetical protein
MRAFTLILMAAMVFGVAAHAQLLPEQTRQRDEIRLQPGMTHVLHFGNRPPVATVSVGNPGVAEASFVAAPNGQAHVLVVAKTGGVTSLNVFDKDGNDFYKATVTVEPVSPPPPPADRVDVHPKGRIVHYYWPYRCNAIRCWRVDDPLAGPAPGTQLSESHTIFDGIPSGTPIVPPPTPVMPESGSP